MRIPSDARRCSVRHADPVPIEPGRPGERRKETAVIDLTDLDLRYADHAVRVGRVGREGWMREASVPTGGSRTWGMATAVGLVRRHLGGALVRIGVRLQETPAGGTADPAAA
jgi:hypothetical protein